MRLADQDIYEAFGAPVLSPDGTRIAYVVGNPNVQSELYIRSLDQLEGTSLASGDLYGPFFSPDGQWVGFFTTSELKKVPVMGGTPQTVCSVDFGFRASWGLDDTIIFGGSFGSGLFRVSASGGEPELLTPANEGDRYSGWPQVLPGGKAVLFNSTTRGFDAANIEVLDLETRQRQVVQRGVYFGRYVPTGHLVYLRQGTLFAVPFDLAELEVKGSAVSIVQGVNDRPLGGGGFSFSNTGTLAYPSAAVVRGHPVVWVDRQGNATPLWEEPGLYGYPRLSPDGTRLAVNTFFDGNTDVWIYDIERGVPTRLTSHPGQDAEAVWSPDGQFLAFESNRSGETSTYRIRADGSAEIELLIDHDLISIPYSWSADGKFLAYGEFHPETDWDIWVQPLEGDQEPQLIVNTDASDGWTEFSPNGRWIAHDSDESGSNEVYVRPYPPGPRKWQVSGNGGSQPRWSADGRELFYRTDTGIMVIAVETEGDDFTYGRAEQLFEGPYLGGLSGIYVGGDDYADYDVSADGQRFVMFPDTGQSSQSGTGTVTLILNWFDELNRLVPSDP